jgi:hypothetical protein
MSKAPEKMVDIESALDNKTPPNAIKQMVENLEKAAKEKEQKESSAENNNKQPTEQPAAENTEEDTQWKEDNKQ